MDLRGDECRVKYNDLQQELPPIVSMATAAKVPAHFPNALIHTTLLMKKQAKFHYYLALIPVMFHLLIYFTTCIYFRKIISTGN